jgi:hypothetical protein
MNSEVGICKCSVWKVLKLEVRKSLKRFLKRINTVEGKEEAAGLRDEFELFEEGHGD